MLSIVVSSFSRDDTNKSPPTHVHCGLKELKNLLDETDLQPECQVTPKGCWISGWHAVPPGVVLCIMGRRACTGCSLRDLLGIECPLSSLGSAYVICMLCVFGSAGKMTLCSGAAFWVWSHPASIKSLVSGEKARMGDESRKGYCMISFILVLVFIDYSFHIQLLSGLAPPPWSITYSPQPERQEMKGPGGNCCLPVSGAVFLHWVWL